MYGLMVPLVLHFGVGAQRRCSVASARLTHTLAGRTERRLLPILRCERAHAVLVLHQDDTLSGLLRSAFAHEKTPPSRSAPARAATPAVRVVRSPAFDTMVKCALLTSIH